MGNKCICSCIGFINLAGRDHLGYIGIVGFMIFSGVFGKYWLSSIATRYCCHRIINRLVLNTVGIFFC